MKQTIALLIALLLSPGCATTGRDLSERESQNIFISEHSKPIVSYPAKTGMIAGFIIGIPATIVLAPVTLPTALIYSKNKGDAESGLPILYFPSAITGFIGQEIVGRPFWLLFGWWGVDEPEDKTEVNEVEAKSLPLTVGRPEMGSGYGK